MVKSKLVFKHIRRTPYQSLAAILITTITFFIVSVFSLAGLGAHQLLQYFESRPQVTAFFHDEATQSDAEALKKQIEDKISIQSSTYISKDQALEIYRAQNQDNPMLLEMVTADILPASLEISAQKVEDLESIAGLMQDNPKVEEVVFQKDVIDTLKSWVRGIRVAGIGLSSLLLLASLTTIIIILGLKFTARKVEINTLSLLGASPWFIRSPFIAEGIIYSMVGAFLGWGFAYILLLYLTPNLVSFLQGITLLPVPLYIMAMVLGVQLVLGLVLGFVASLVATRRYGR